MSSLRKLKELEDAEIEAAQRGPERMEPADPPDLSEPIFFDSPSRAETRRRGTLLIGHELEPRRLPASGASSSRNKGAGAFGPSFTFSFRYPDTSFRRGGCVLFKSPSRGIELAS